MREPPQFDEPVSRGSDETDEPSRVPAGPLDDDDYSLTAATVLSIMNDEDQDGDEGAWDRIDAEIMASIESAPPSEFEGSNGSNVSPVPPFSLPAR